MTAPTGMRTTRVLSLTWLAALMLLAGCTLTAAEPTVPPYPSALPAVQGGWPTPGALSGVNGDPVIDRASVEAFCAWRGRACGVAQVPTARDSWADMTGGTWFYDNFEGFPGRLVITQGLVPDGRPQDLAGCAAGAHDAEWQTFGRTMVQRGRADSIVRLGWEFNGTYLAWRATDPATWISCFRAAATNIRIGNPGVSIEWTINGHVTDSATCGGVSTNCYPGDDVVDIVGIDYYDQGTPVRSATDFSTEAARPEGLDWLLAFARTHGKRFAVGEWGVAPGSTGNSTGQNPDYIRWMHDWFTAHAADLVYETYFNDCSPGEVQSNLWRPVGNGCVRLNAQAGDVYRSLWAGPGSG